MISVIIPAYNEEAVIGRTIRSVLAALGREPGELIVVCNGCRDGTYAVASGVDPSVQVVDVKEGSKTNALNMGDEKARFFPRFYLDADIELSANALQTVAKLLRGGEIHAAAPRMECRFAEASWGVRAFYRVWLARPYHRVGHVGSGFIGLSQAGRGRFGRFPDIIADDGYVHRHFTANERAVVDSAWFAIHTPQNVRSLVKVKTRSRLGTLQLESLYPELNGHLGDAELASRLPSGPTGSWADRLTYGAITSMARLRARRQWAKRLVKHWERDDSSRVALEASRGRQ
jgi:glycosyltransferase involved in cell wall biosynthesis